jgi:hypothetical protein
MTMGKRPSVVGPRLNVSPRQESELRKLSDALERETVAQYEQYLFNRRRLDTTRWKAVRTHEDLHVFTERDDFRKTWRHESKQPASPGPMALLIQPSSVPMSFLTGTIQGSVDDALFGNTFLDTPSLRVRDTYLEQKADNATLLTVVDAPHAEDPFNFLGITYTTRKSVVGVASRPRDLLLLTGVRASKLTTGERIGFAFHHSITHKALPRNFTEGASVRADASMVVIYRQLDGGRVEVFMLDFCDLNGKNTIASYAAERQAMALLVPRANGCSAGVDKKLYWLMRERQRARVNDPERDSIASPRSSSYSVVSEPYVETGCCDICDSSFRRLGRSASRCQLCGEVRPWSLPISLIFSTAY